MNFIVDKFIFLDVDDETTMKRVKESLEEKYGSDYDDAKAEASAKIKIQEYNAHIDGVKEMFKGQNISVIDANQPKDIVLEEIARLINLKNTENEPKRAPRIIITGPPGSGRSTQARNLCEKFNLVHVTTMVKNEIGKNTRAGKQMWKTLKSGDPVPDTFVQDIIKDRLSKLDCKINGYVMEGFPSATQHFQTLKEFGAEPSHIICLELSDSKVYERLENR